MEVPTNNNPTIIIVGAGIGGLSFYHSVRKNLGKKFNVKIFERETSPQDRWQVQSRFPEAMPDSVPKEHHAVAVIDHVGRNLCHIPLHQTKTVYEIEPLKHDFAGIVTYRNRLRDVLLEDVDIQWGKKCVGYEESDDGVWVLFEDGTREFGNLLIGADGINSPIRKQKVPNLEILDLGVTSIDVDISVPKNLAERLMSTYANAVVQKSIGRNGGKFFSMMRFIPINQSKETCYRVTLGFSYPTDLDLKDNISIDDNNPESVIKHAISRIKQSRSSCELTDLMIELFSLVPLSNPGEKYPFRTYNPPRRRQLRDINPLSVPPWKNDRIVLLGDAANAMNPLLGLGVNNAIQDADLLTKELLNYANDNLIECIQRYNEQMRARSSKDVLTSRDAVLKQRTPLGNFGLVVRYIFYRILNVIIYVFAFFKTHF
ncbi:FAD/NADP-binding domain-containing protein [Gigaspora margarita]|uniref:FAD/NADP-binding domain-containing protein n=1 Tax=Gigaspora margarita TaxID=4874 RepID=A0A8H4A520_GIGMA|nr:FAD/NADP-binding domain-containing protein [Gigaspora margarita]